MLNETIFMIYLRSLGACLSKTKNGKKNRLAFLTVLVFINLYSCASAASAKQPYVYLTDNAKYILLSPGGIEKPMDAAQYISASYGGQDYFFNAWVKADKTGMDIALFNELGAAIAELSYKDGVVSLSSRVLPGSLRPEYIVADFQLCFYEPVLLRQAIKECGLVLETRGGSQEGTMNIRRILRGKRLIIEIEKAHQEVKLKNYQRGYSYTLKGDNI